MNGGDEPGQERRSHGLPQRRDVDGSRAEVAQRVVHSRVPNQHRPGCHRAKHGPVPARKPDEGDGGRNGQQREGGGRDGVDARGIAPYPDGLAHAPADHVVARPRDGAEQREGVAAQGAAREPRVPDTDEARPDHREPDAPRLGARRVLAQPQRRDRPREHRLERHEDDRAGDGGVAQRGDPRPEMQRQQEARERHQHGRPTSQGRSMLRPCTPCSPFLRSQHTRHRQHQRQPPERDRQRGRRREAHDRAGVRRRENRHEEHQEGRHGRETSPPYPLSAMRSPHPPSPSPQMRRGGANGRARLLSFPRNPKLRARCALPCGCRWLPRRTSC